MRDFLRGSRHALPWTARMPAVGLRLARVLEVSALLCAVSTPACHHPPRNGGTTTTSTASARPPATGHATRREAAQQSAQHEPIDDFQLVCVQKEKGGKFYCESKPTLEVAKVVTGKDLIAEANQAISRLEAIGALDPAHNAVLDCFGGESFSMSVDPFKVATPADASRGQMDLATYDPATLGDLVTKDAKPACDALGDLSAATASDSAFQAHLQVDGETKSQHDAASARMKHEVARCEALGGNIRNGLSFGGTSSAASGVFAGTVSDTLAALGTISTARRVYKVVKSFVQGVGEFLDSRSTVTEVMGCLYGGGCSPARNSQLISNAATRSIAVAALTAMKSDPAYKEDYDRYIAYLRSAAKDGDKDAKNVLDLLNEPLEAPVDTQSSGSGSGGSSSSSSCPSGAACKSSSSGSGDRSTGSPGTGGTGDQSTGKSGSGGSKSGSGGASSGTGGSGSGGPKNAPKMCMQDSDCGDTCGSLKAAWLWSIAMCDAGGWKSRRCKSLSSGPDHCPDPWIAMPRPEPGQQACSLAGKGLPRKLVVQQRCRLLSWVAERPDDKATCADFGDLTHGLDVAKLIRARECQHAMDLPGCFGGGPVLMTYHVHDAAELAHLLQMNGLKASDVRDPRSGQKLHLGKITSDTVVAIPVRLPRLSGQRGGGLHGAPLPVQKNRLAR